MATKEPNREVKVWCYQETYPVPNTNGEYSFPKDVDLVGNFKIPVKVGDVIHDEGLAEMALNPDSFKEGIHYRTELR